MEFMEDSEILSLFSGNASLWGQLPDEEEFHLGSGLDSHLKETELSSGLDSTGPNSPQSDVSDDPLPDWMSQKVSLSAWLGDEEDIPMADLMTIPSSPPPKSTSPPAEDSELFKELLAEIGVPPTPASSVEDQSAEALLAMSPVSSISDPGSPVYQETMSQLISEPSSPMVSGVDSAPVGDLEEQALALLDAMGCMEFTTNQEPSGAQVITITLPMIEDQMAIQQQLIQPPDSPSSIDSSMPASPEESPMPSPSPSPTPKRTKSKPKLKNTSPIEKKSRKRDQNKNAATRYRVKKRIETDAVEGELKGLEDTNRELKDKAEGLEKEIKYLKDLLIRVLKGTISNIKST
ncbi:cyclic AMP-dependent transcription factor ATF-5 [Strongylocentrotus purpuratus]|uniref:BZIP domain-containing protein n=1 Tax=Strongylocentrotus purpuratus TaxID=7668 RepID=A0A7M7LVQ8_STRPU|nr:cyclic AMP-dependent transcription factor ATF-5 [Strongylocentrotus purpuratus]